MTPMQKMVKARSALVTSFPFFGSLALRLELVESDAVETMGTDGVRLVYNPAFLEELTMPELTGVIAHEVMHCALNHVTRVGKRDRDQFNIAADYALNPIVRDAGLTLPKCALIDSCYTGKSADEIYGMLPAKSPQAPQGGGPGGTGQGATGQNAPSPAPARDPGRCGGILPAPPGQSPADAAKIEQEWKIATVQAANAARAAGKLPGGLSRLVEEIKQPAVDWREVLRRFISSAKPSAYSWTPPNRRFVSRGMYLPALKPDGLGRVAVFIDTSGSIDGPTLAMFSAELNGILDDVKPDFCSVVYCDAAVNSAAEYEAADYPIKLKAQGGGGTDFRPPFAYLEREGIRADVAVYLTDGECSSFPAAPEYPVLWALTGRGRSMPFGETVSLPKPI